MVLDRRRHAGHRRCRHRAGFQNNAGATGKSHHAENPACSSSTAPATLPARLIRWRNLRPWAKCCSSIRISSIATDDMYEHILLWAAKFVNILNVCPELYDRTMVLNGVSKAYAMTGWRIGYCGGPARSLPPWRTSSPRARPIPLPFRKSPRKQRLTAISPVLSPWWPRSGNVTGLSPMRSTPSPASNAFCPRRILRFRRRPEGNQ